MNMTSKENSNSKLLDSLIPKTASAIPAPEPDVRTGGTSAAPESKERNIAAEIVAESARKKAPEPRVTMTIHIPQSLANKVDAAAKKGNLSRNELVRLILEKATA